MEKIRVRLVEHGELAEQLQLVPLLERLLVDKSRIKPVPRQQLLMTALFDHLPVAENDDEVGVLDRGQAMCDYDARASRAGLVQRLLHHLQVHHRDETMEQYSHSGMDTCGEGLGS